MQLIAITIEETFQALSDPTRLRVVRLLASTKEEACLCELVDSLLEPQYKLSRHLKILRNVGILDAEKDGRWVYHRLAAQPNHMKDLLSVIAALPDPKGVFGADRKLFEQRLTHREGGRCRIGVLTKALKTEAA